ncbi:MAG: hypothetical protein LQ346_007605, partial [Caloplaca aetnensis]
MGPIFRLIIALLFCLATMQRSMAAPAPATPPVPVTPAGHWPGWDGIEKLFVFGASYTATGFQWLNGQAPSPEHPLGNSLRGPTSSNGPNFITYLTTTFNASKVQTYNFAFPGAQVDWDLTAPGYHAPADHNDMKAQVNHSFMPSYTPRVHAPYAEWSGNSSLFVSFFGINDILAYYGQHRPFSPAAAAATTDAVMASYAEQLAHLYAAGARNFLLVNTPPMDRMPYFTLNHTRTAHGPDSLTPAARAWHRESVRETVALWNAGISALVSSFQASHPDATLFWYDIHALFEDMLSQPALADAYADTYGLQRLTHLSANCEWYSKLDAAGHEMYLGEDDFKDER